MSTSRSRSTYSLVLLLLLCLALPVRAEDTARSVVKLMNEIRTADYKGNLKRLDALCEKSNRYLNAPDQVTRARIRYWRGFAKWRWAINAFNETPLPAQTGAHLFAAIAEFDEAALD